MKRIPRRRNRFGAIAAALVAATAAGGEATGIEATVGAYYYPWWGPTGGHTNWDDTLRAHLTPTEQPPEAGYYDSGDAGVIAEHINQSHRGNISLWANSWWGPGSSTDTVLRQHILPHPRAGELKHAVHYESVGRFGDPQGAPTFTNLVPDFEYLAQNVFSDSSYYRIDDRPVVFMYVTRAFFDAPEAQQALADARQTLQQDYGYDPYVIGDEIFGSSFNASRAALFDAVTTFDVYGMSGLKQNDATPQDVATAESKYAAASEAGATVIPGVTPGYNDTAVRDGNQPTARYFEGETIADAGSVFTSLIEQAALPHVDPLVNNLLMVNSFNEWHEDTQIEPTIVGAPTAADDSATGTDFTDGKTYEGYGVKYLDLLRIATTDAGIPLLDGDADFDGDLDEDDLLAFAASWQQEYLLDGERVGGAESRESMPDFNYDGVVDFFDWFVMRNNHPSAPANPLVLLQVPEPACPALLAVAILAYQTALGSRSRAARITATLRNS